MGKIIYVVCAVLLNPYILFLFLDQLTMDLYSLGTPLLTHIWKFTEKIYRNDMDED